MGLRLQVLSEAEKHLGILDDPQKVSQQVASCNWSGLDRK